MTAFYYYLHYFVASEKMWMFQKPQKTSCVMFVTFFWKTNGMTWILTVNLHIVCVFFFKANPRNNFSRLTYFFPVPENMDVYLVKVQLTSQIFGGTWPVLKKLGNGSHYGIRPWCSKRHLTLEVLGEIREGLLTSL